MVGVCLGDEVGVVQFLFEVLCGEVVGGGVVDVDVVGVLEFGDVVFEFVDVELLGGVFDGGGFGECDFVDGCGGVVVMVYVFG